MTPSSERAALTAALTLFVATLLGLSMLLAPVARTAPLVVGIPTFFLLAIALLRDIRGGVRPALQADARTVEERRLLGWLALLIALAGIGGVMVGVPVWLAVFLRGRSGESWPTAAAFAAVLLLVFATAFMVLLRIDPLSGSFITSP